MGQVVEFRRRKDDFIRQVGFDTQAAILARRIDLPPAIVPKGDADCPKATDRVATLRYRRLRSV
jgi:hypothetical protein